MFIIYSGQYSTLIPINCSEYKFNLSTLIRILNDAVDCVEKAVEEECGRDAAEHQTIIEKRYLNRLLQKSVVKSVSHLNSRLQLNFLYRRMSNFGTTMIQASIKVHVFSQILWLPLQHGQHRYCNLYRPQPWEG